MNFFCTKSKYFLFDVEIVQIPDILKTISLDWFNPALGYKKAWKNCPKEFLDKLRTIPEFQLEENKKKFKEITGLDI